MPIEKALFEIGTKPSEERILDLLNGAPNSAFSIYEIIGACEQVKVDTGMDRLSAGITYLQEYRKTLDKLISQKKIRTSRIGGEWYYGI